MPDADQLIHAWAAARVTEHYELNPPVTAADVERVEFKHEDEHHYSEYTSDPAYDGVTVTLTHGRFNGVQFNQWGEKVYVRDFYFELDDGVQSIPEILREILGLLERK